MGIWEQLGIVPTTDKRQIKKAYAARSREVHPEEKPEEFRLLYDAYQAALTYAKKEGESQAKKDGERAPDSQSIGFGSEGLSLRKPEAVSLKEPEEEAAEETEGERELRLHLEKQTEAREEKLERFLEHWKEVHYLYRDPKEQEWWKQYLRSKEFQDIQWHPKILKLLGEEMEKKLGYEYVIRLYFWEAYAFQKAQGAGAYGSQGDLLKLRRGIYPAYEHKLKEEAREQREEELRQIDEIRRRFVRRIGRILAVMFVVAMPFFIYFYVTAERRYVENYMKREYPHTEFSKPERVRKEYYGVWYEMYPLSHPDFLVTVHVRYNSREHKFWGERNDYGTQLLQYYAKQYGLEFDRLDGDDYRGQYWSTRCDEIGLLYYPDLESIDEFCDRVLQMFQEQTELQDLYVFAICKKDALYPKTLLRGGERNSGAEEQFYYSWDMRELEASEFKQRVREAGIAYVSRYESESSAEQEGESEVTAEDSGPESDNPEEDDSVSEDVRIIVGPTLEIE